MWASAGRPCSPCGPARKRRTGRCPSTSALLGGFGSLRGFRAGAFTGDNLAEASLELRVPFHSPLHLGQTGLTVFGDAGAAYDHGVKLSDARVEYGAGGGWYLRVPLFQLEVDVAYGFDSGTRVHVTAGFKF